MSDIVFVVINTEHYSIVKQNFNTCIYYLLKILYIVL